MYLFSRRTILSFDQCHSELRCTISGSSCHYRTAGSSAGLALAHLLSQSRLRGLAGVASALIGFLEPHDIFFNLLPLFVSIGIFVWRSIFAPVILCPARPTPAIIAIVPRPFTSALPLGERALPPWLGVPVPGMAWRTIVSTYTSRFLQKTEVCDFYPLVHCFAHVVNGKASHRCSR